MLPEEIIIPRPEPRFLYSNRNYWYPQPPITDYATATLRITVPSGYSCVASGEADPDSPQLIPSSDPALTSKRYAFNATRPLRYLAFLVSRFAQGPRTVVDFQDVANDGAGPASMPGQFNALDLEIEANPRQVQRGKEVSGDATDILRFYYGLIGDSPYSTMTLALVDDLLPGGHSPAHFVALNLALPATPLVWRNDPAAFNNFPEFFLAHEIAHQWWGQAIGWRNYHEQWLSEGFAQYFATLYAHHRRGDEVFASVLRQLRKWSIEQSDQGPVYLGYRLGHVRNDSRVFRALVYNKGAAVLHMLRRFVGDDAFFKGIRTFYRDFRYAKAGTEDLRAAMENASGRPLTRFFERWIYGSTLPRLVLSHRIEAGSKGQELVLRVEQVGDLFDVPVSLTVEYSDRKTPVLIIVDDRVVERRVPLAGMFRSVSLNTDDGVVAELADN